MKTVSVLYVPFPAFLSRAKLRPCLGSSLFLMCRHSHGNTGSFSRAEALAMYFSLEVLQSLHSVSALLVLPCSYLLPDILQSGVYGSTPSLGWFLMILL